MLKTKIVNIYKEPYDVYIGRSGKNKDGYFGNPIRLIKGEERGATIERYKTYFYNRLKEDSEFKSRIEALRGKSLGCFCKPNTCHGDVIKEYLDKPYKILVCGSRDVREYKFICSTLDFLISRRDLSSLTIIHGAQKSFDKSLEINYGADYLAGQWCKSRNVEQIPFPADWDQHGKKGGVIRNSLLLKQNPDAFVAFFKKGAANRGTTDMVGKLKKAGIQGREYWC